MAGLLGQKIGMTQIFDDEKGERIPVTVVRVGPCTVVEKRTPEKNGYSAIQIGFGERTEKRLPKAMRGHFAKAGVPVKRFVREVRVPEGKLAEFEVGQELRVSEQFKNGDLVDVVGTSKGRGFQGVMKRHNFSGFPASHGTHEMFRATGAVGARKWPGRVQKGQKMAGHMGDERVTIEHLEVVQVQEEENLLLLRGGVPGARNSLVFVRPSKRS